MFFKVFEGFQLAPTVLSLVFVFVVVMPAISLSAMIMPPSIAWEEINKPFIVCTSCICTNKYLPKSFWRGMVFLDVVFGPSLTGRKCWH